MFLIAGMKQEGVLFLVADSQITGKNEILFVYINELLSSSNIPDLYTKDEKEIIIAKISPKAKRAGFSGPHFAWDYFLSQVRQNLHVCLCFSPIGTTLRSRARRFPALTNCTVRCTLNNSTLCFCYIHHFLDSSFLSLLFRLGLTITLFLFFLPLISIFVFALRPLTGFSLGPNKLSLRSQVRHDASSIYLTL